MCLKNHRFPGAEAPLVDSESSMWCTKTCTECGVAICALLADDPVDIPADAARP